ncbi:glycosyltransferase family 2 protein [Jannaschia sp. W003]|uniref:glycosyltransferase n=1 Tax=Jannaschia sp. W003 TaxID=2867012 RepID=UPI0021A4CE21|nr:glycosyltransferase family 2 protein [Jannaschia sp. W003]UWQ22073.1 glycosyltransferase [Jannaschia sp. W003]
MSLLLLAFAIVALALALLYAAMTLVNLGALRPPPRGGAAQRPVSILIPARDEAGNIEGALHGALSQRDAEIEVVVLDDGSADGTDRIVEAAAAADPRVRLLRGAPLPEGWNGKQHACHQLAEAARHPVLLFVDADVRLAPDAVARLWTWLESFGLALVSGFPRQITRTLPEIVAIPQILVVLLGYLPVPMARARPDPAFAAGCGQLLMVTRGAYEAAGGHAAFRDRMHDGLNLPRNVRRAGGRTDLVDATPLAHVRMYEDWPAIVEGFSKNATEGMATPRALPVWTALLFGGHVLPFLVLPLALLAGAWGAAWLSLAAVVLLLAARTVLAWRMHQHPLSVLLHPVGVLVTLWIQFRALRDARRGRRVTWRGRAYGAR